MATDITRGELIRLPWDYARYGLDPDEQLVADAVRASMSIPFFFEPVPLDSNGAASTLVDGGVLSNFPIDTFDRTDAAAPALADVRRDARPAPAGRQRATCCPARAAQPRAAGARWRSLVTTTIVGHDQAQLAKPWVAARTIEVDT